MFQGMMAPHWRSSTKSARYGLSEVPEQSKASGDSKLREQLAALVRVVRQHTDVVALPIDRLVALPIAKCAPHEPSH